MNEHRAQRTVGPTHIARADASHGTATSVPAFRPEDPFILFAYAVLAREAQILAAHRPNGDDAPTPDDIHQLRVAARRLRVALRLFRRMLPSAGGARLRAELRWFASSLGDVRDLDVYTESFRGYLQALPPAQRRGLSGYELYLRRERAEARQQAAAAFASPRSAALFSALERFVAAGPSAGALRRWRALTVRDAARRGIRRSVGRVRRLGEQLGEHPRPAALHELRIKAKRLRYELDFFAEIYPHLKQTAKACKSVQDLLGMHQDAYTANARLRRYTTVLRKQAGGRALPPALVELRRTQFAIARRVRQSFKEQWPAFAATIDAARRAVA
jgi:CHAD domain-containing protein